MLLIWLSYSMDLSCWPEPEHGWSIRTQFNYLGQARPGGLFAPRAPSSIQDFPAARSRMHPCGIELWREAVVIWIVCKARQMHGQGQELYFSMGGLPPVCARGYNV